MSKELDQARELVRMLEEKENQNKVQLSSLIPGDTFNVGKVEMIVLEQLSEPEGTAVITKGFIANNVEFGDSKDYKTSNIRNIIEKNFLPEFEKEVGVDNIVTQNINLTSVDMQNEYGAISCKVRPITFDEARKYNDLLVAKEIGDWWWTCTPWSTKDRGWEYSMAVVSPSGNIRNYNFNCSGGVRPFCILKSNIFVSKGEC